MGSEESRLFVPRALARSIAVALASLLMMLAPAWAQDVSSASVNFDDIRQALIWTGHYNIFTNGDAASLTHAAMRDWQKSKGYEADGNPTESQLSELLSEGLKQREQFGWSTLNDKSVGFSIGVPTRLVKFLSNRMADGIQWYDFEGTIGLSIGVQYGIPNCLTLNTFYAQILQRSRASYHARQDNWFAIANEKAGRLDYSKVLCSSSGILIVNVIIPHDQLANQGVVMAAIAESVKLGRNFDTTASPHPKFLTPPAVVAGSAPANGKIVQPHAPAKLASGVDGTGKTDALKREAWTGTELRTEEVFSKAGGAVYIVKAGKMQGSAVAVSDHDVLTNCHVVGELSRVTLIHDKLELQADVVSGDVAADRCVLHSATALASWVSVRPYDDIKVGERALSIGAPSGLELTIAEGLVSSKRTLKQRLIQTSAPVSPGSSGGGLFDAEGHLLAITTFQLVAGQNLNFAVAAEEYAK